jgi:hypothetical protein
MYNDLAPGHPDNPKTYRICGAKTRNEVSAPLCTLAAGWATNHPGQGRCKLHGGATLRGVESPQFKHGRYSKVLRQQIKDKLAEQEPDPAALDLVPELEVERVMVGLALERLQRRILPAPGGGLAAASSGIRQVNNGPADDLPEFPARADNGSGPDETNATSDNGIGPDDKPEGQGIIEQMSGDSFSLMENPASRVGDTGGSKMVKLEGIESHQLTEFSSNSEFEEFQLPIEGISLTELMEGVSFHVEKVVKIAEKIQMMRNDTSLAKAEMLFLRKALEDLMKRYLDEDKYRAFVRELAQLIPASGPG